MQQFIRKLEMKYGKYAITDLMKYILGLSAIGAVLGLASPSIYYQYLMLDFDKIFHGQVWRLITFVLYPRLSRQTLMIDILFFAIMVYLYISIGRALERSWGTFRFNLFIFSGILMTILATLIFYLVTGYSYGLSETYGLSYANLEQIFQAVILAFAFLFPEATFLIYFIIPVKAKYLGYIYIGFSIFVCFQDFMMGDFLSVLLFVVAFVNFLIFYYMGKGNGGGYYQTSNMRRQRKARQQKPRKEAAAREQTGRPRHRCVICGRTDLDNPGLDFRYCSKCVGNFEYCSEHIFTHEHVK